MTTIKAHTEYIKVNLRLIQLIRIAPLDLYCSVFLPPLHSTAQLVLLWDAVPHTAGEGLRSWLRVRDSQ